MTHTTIADFSAGLTTGLARSSWLAAVPCFGRLKVRPSAPTGFFSSSFRARPKRDFAALTFRIGLCTLPTQVAAQSLESLQNLSLEDLSQIQITSVSKQTQALSDAAAAVYVIGHDDIIRSGARTIPEILRLAPNLQVARTGASNYVITARGFSGNSTAQNFSNKLLVLIDGRSVYTPLYSGVYWDMQDVLAEDIDRIEVISGPSATLWGANAVNGVINITTRKSADTQGGFAELGTGNTETSASVRYGGRLSDEISYRIYAKAFYERAFKTSTGANAQDGWYKPQGGFRVDWTHAGDLLTFQGDLYQGHESQPGPVDELISGGNVQARWQHAFTDGATAQIFAYYDETRRYADDHNGGFTLRTYDLEAQHDFSLGSWSHVIWGAGERTTAYTIANQIGTASSLLFIPGKRTLNLADGFVQDRIAVTGTLDVTPGLKIEDDPYSGIAWLPSVRAAWKPDSSVLLWAAVSRAVRSPTPFDRDVAEKLGSTLFLTGNPNFLPETLTAYEAGYRGQITPDFSVSVSGFYNDYDNLKSIEFSSGALPLIWGNMMQGRVYGVEAWATYRLADWWQLDAGFNVQHEDLEFVPGASRLLGVAQAGDDPHHQASLRSSMNLMDGVTLDADLRYVGTLPNPKVPAYAEVNLRLAWAVSNDLELSLSGLNLLHSYHQEFPPPASDKINRSVFFDIRRKF